MLSTPSTLVLSLLITITGVGNLKSYLVLFAFMTLAAGGMTMPSPASTKRDSDLDTRVFHNIAAAAVELSNAHAHPTKDLLTIERSVRDWDNDCRQSYLYQIPLPNGSRNQSPFITPPTLLPNSIVARLVSPSGEKTVIVQKKESDGGANEGPVQQRHMLQIWKGSALIRQIPLDKYNGAVICNDVTFGSPSWSPDEKCLVYAGERLPPKTSSYWSNDDKDNDNDNHNDNDSSSATLRGSQNVLGEGIAEDWGERYQQQSPLLDLFVVNIETGRVARIPFLDDQFYNAQSTLGSVSLGQAVFDPVASHRIAFTCFDAGGMNGMSRRLGMVFCRNRPSQVYTADIGQLLTRLAREGDDNDEDDETPSLTVLCTSVSYDFRLARSPRLVHLQSDDDKVALVFLGNKRGFHSHDGCMGLYVQIQGETQVVNEVIPVIEDPKAEGPKVPSTSDAAIGFPGIFTGDLPVDCGIKGTDSILLNTLWGSMTRVIQVDLMTGNLSLVDFNESHPLASHSILCQVRSSKTDNIEMVISETSSNLPARLWRLSIPKNEMEQTKENIVSKAIKIVDFGSISCTSYSTIEPTLEGSFDVELLSVPTGNDDDSFQAILLLPKHLGKEKRKPLVVVPHGGPHAASTSSFVPGFVFLAGRYAVVLPNYRGSIGFGQRVLTSLLKNIGRNDVDDVMTCTKHVLDNYSDRIDSSRVAICGGSHGGFLTAHCTSQYPQFFKAAIMRNPVTNIASMVTATDISDWCHAECLGTTFDHGSSFRGPSKDEMVAMYERSPIINIGKVQTPTLIALGMQDLRVPPSQGKEWYYTIRSMGVPTELLIYPKDNHSLSLVGTEANHWIRIARWLRLHLES